VGLRSFSFTVWDVPKPLGRPRFARTKTGVRTYTDRKDQNVRFNIRKEWLLLGHSPLEGPLRLTMCAWLPMPKSVAKKLRATALPAVRPDLDNYVKQVEDALQSYAYYDDKQIVTIIARKRYVAYEDETVNSSPRWEIQLDEIQEVI
jgi:Holliday junction resolvase RusA-like endonuclease